MSAICACVAFSGVSLGVHIGVFRGLAELVIGPHEGVDPVQVEGHPHVLLHARGFRVGARQLPDVLVPRPGGVIIILF